MVSVSLTLTFNLLTDYYSREQPSSLCWLSDEGIRGVQKSEYWSESTPAGVSVFQQDADQDKGVDIFDWKGGGAGVIFRRVFLKLVVYS